MKHKHFDWLKEKVTSPHAHWWLALAFALETILFVPLDPLLVLFCIENRSRAYFYATVATIASVVGAVGAYCLGALMWDSIGARLVDFLMSKETFNTMVQYYQSYSSWVVLVGGFLPIPFKVITLTAGFCKLAIIPFVLACTISRGIRFFLVATASYLYGREIKYFLDRHFTSLVFLVAVKIVVVVVILVVYRMVRH